MTRAPLVLVALLSCGAAPFGCADDDPDEVQSAQVPACRSIAVSAFVPGTIESAPVLITGIASTSDHAAIQAILVGPVAAAADGFNFTRWSVSLEADQLMRLPLAGDEPDHVLLPLRAIDHRGVVCDPTGEDPAVTVDLPTGTRDTPGRDAGPLDAG